MRIVLLDVRVPFATGGTGATAAGLEDALRAHGHEVDTVTVPFRWHPPELVLDHMLASRLLNIEEANGAAIDLAIGLTFPAYLIPHPNKVLWVTRQFRQAYDLVGTAFDELRAYPLGSQVCDAVRQADQACFRGARRTFAATRSAADRIRGFCGVDAESLYHPPPHAERFYGGEYRSYLYVPGRARALERQGLALEALARAGEETRVVFSGIEENAPELVRLKDLAARLGVDGRVTWRGRVSEEEKRALYANCRAVLFPARDEDCGQVTLEAMLSGKAVVTCRDSGGAEEFVTDGETGFVTDPDPGVLADALDRLRDPGTAERMGRAGQEAVRELDLTWSRVVERLLG